MARPLKDIEPWRVYKLARIGCTNEEIAVILDCHKDTLTNRFSDALRKGRERMKMSLRRMQYKAACAGDRTILIWMGKQYLGQRDKQDVTTTIVVDELTKVRQSAAYVLQKKLDRGVAFEKAMEEMRLGEMNPEDIEWAATLSPDERQQQIQEFGRVD